MSFWELLVLIEQRGERIIEQKVHEVITDKNRYVRSKQGLELIGDALPYLWITV